MTVVIIDPATGGVAGLYLEAYSEIADRNGVSLVGAKSSIPPAKYPFFYPMTDLADGAKKRFGPLRLPIRYLELIHGLIRSLVLILRRRPKAVMYALSSNLMPEYLFLSILKRIGVKVIIICHDVIPFVSAYEIRKLKTQKRYLFYKKADILICHNKASMRELVNHFNIPYEKISYIPFPILDLRKARGLLNASRQVGRNDRRRIRFLFIGHVRAEKGINTLIRSWKIVASSDVDLELVVAGQVSKGVTLVAREIANMTIIDQYICERDFIEHIMNADCVILPYDSGTNSGILSSVLSLGRPVITSDIEMFKESGLISDDWMFEAGNADALARKILNFSQMPKREMERQRQTVYNIRDQRILSFNSEVQKILCEIG